MAIGARDYIDKLLVKKYADEKVDNHEAMESMVDPNKMLEAMNDVATIQRNMFNLLRNQRKSCKISKTRNGNGRRLDILIYHNFMKSFGMVDITFQLQSYF